MSNFWRHNFDFKHVKTRIDTSDSTYIYKGYAKAGTAESDYGWVIERIKKSNGNTDLAEYGLHELCTWNNRGALNYL